MDVDTTSERLQDSKTLDSVYAKSFILKIELSSAEMEAAVSNNYGNIQSAFNNFQNNLKNLVNNKKYLVNPNNKLL